MKNNLSHLFELYLKTVLTSYYWQPSVAFDAMQFVLGNLETLCYDTNLLFKYFPNLFKVGGIIKSMLFHFRNEMFLES